MIACCYKEKINNIGEISADIYIYIRNGERNVIFVSIPTTLCRVPNLRAGSLGSSMGSRWESNTEKELIKYSGLPPRGSHFSVVFRGKNGDLLCNLGTQTIDSKTVILESLCRIDTHETKLVPGHGKDWTTVSGKPTKQDR